MPSYYSVVYLIGLKSESEFWGNLTSTELILLQGEGNRQWIEVHYPNGSKRGCGKKVLIPEKPEDPHAILDTCMAFLPEVFKDIPSHGDLKRIVGNSDRIDLNLDKPKEWDGLRSECIKFMERLDVKALQINCNSPIFK